MKWISHEIISRQPWCFKYNLTDLLPWLEILVWWSSCVGVGGGISSEEGRYVYYGIEGALGEYLLCVNCEHVVATDILRLNTHKLYYWAHTNLFHSEVPWILEGRHSLRPHRDTLLH